MGLFKRKPKKRELSVGSRLFNVIAQIDKPKPLTIDTHFKAMTAARLLEEAVELALAHSLPAREIIAHVVDAVHNECKKANCYPSDLNATGCMRSDAVTELADVQMCLQYLGLLSNISQAEIDAAAEEKIRKLEKALANGELKIVDCRIYRKEAR